MQNQPVCFWLGQMTKKRVGVSANLIRTIIIDESSCSTRLLRTCSYEELISIKHLNNSTAGSFVCLINYKGLWCTALLAETCGGVTWFSIKKYCLIWRIKAERSCKLSTTQSRLTFVNSSPSNTRHREVPLAKLREPLTSLRRDEGALCSAFQ